jgi:hypothetical protein
MYKHAPPSPSINVLVATQLAEHVLTTGYSLLTVDEVRA